MTTLPKRIAIILEALKSLGGDGKAIDTEDVAVECYRLSPGLFGWSKYPEQINLELVRVGLSDAKKASYGSLVAGVGKSGWRLTAQGLLVAARLISQDPTTDAEPHSRRANLHVAKLRRERARILNSDAWAIWQREHRITPDALRTLLRIDEYSSSSRPEEKAVQIAALLSDDEDLRDFFRELLKQARHFSTSPK